jgi:hypothetical protein
MLPNALPERLALKARSPPGMLFKNEARIDDVENASQASFPANDPA